MLETSNNLPASQLHLLYRHVARRPFITSRGHLGLGLVDMLPGDRVVVLFGAELPLVLRRYNEGYYQVIGEAYIHGVMDGEVMTMGFKSKSFDIRRDRQATTNQNDIPHSVIIYLKGESYGFLRHPQRHTYEHDIAIPTGVVLF